jgi:hypothetical protein
MSRLIVRRGLNLQLPNIFTIDTSLEMKLATGLDNIVFTVNNDGSFSANVVLNFLFANTASDFVNTTEWFKVSGGFKQLTSSLPASTDTQISDVWFFLSEDAFLDFSRELFTDVSLELKLK